MSFRVPAMPLAVNIWRVGNNVANPPDVVTVCNLSPGKRTMTAFASLEGGNFSQPTLLMQALLPKGTDVRPAAGTPGSDQGDILEIPAATGRFYTAVGVDDVGRGFSNEYRLAEIAPMDNIWRTAFGNPNACPPWPMPIP